jgi:hypothetical protein
MVQVNSVSRRCHDPDKRVGLSVALLAQAVQAFKGLTAGQRLLQQKSRFPLPTKMPVKRIENPQIRRQLSHWFKFFVFHNFCRHAHESRVDNQGRQAGNTFVAHKDYCVSI